VEELQGWRSVRSCGVAGLEEWQELWCGRGGGVAGVVVWQGWRSGSVTGMAEWQE